MPEDQIRPEGPIDAKIFIVGEAPGEQEVKEGRPFVGPAGRVLDGLLRDAGIIREQCYITNLILWRPDGNDFTKLYNDSNEPTDELRLAIARLTNELNAVKPNVVLCLGERATRAITGKRGIGNWRGSCVYSTFNTGSSDNGGSVQQISTERSGEAQRATSETGVSRQPVYKCLPVYHPSAIARDWTLRQTTLVDFQRALRESVFQEIRQEERIYHICTNGISDVRNQLSAIKECVNVAFDIETESGQITAIAFAPDNRPNWAVCIPFWFGGSGSLWTSEEEVEIWGLIREVLTDERIGKIAHNGMYDIEFIERLFGYRVKPFTFDTMLGMHALYLELPKSLAYAVSLYTDHPYYKDAIHSTSMQEYFRYNATDACLTMEIAVKLMQEIREDGLWDFYKNYIHGLWEPLLQMQLTGVKFDHLRRNSIKKRMQEEVAVLQKNLDAAVGHPLNTNSPKQMKEWLYQELKYKPKTKRKKGSSEETVTADEEALDDLYRETKDQRLKTVIKIRERQKVISTYLEAKLDDDKRMRCSYSITGTETGRLSSSKTLRGTGTNLQNVPPGPVKTLFIPDEGKVFINADLSQAEARVVAYIANESRLIRVFEGGGDIHRKNAANIFKIDESAVTDEQRQMAKRVVHASNYGMGPITFSRQCDIPASEAKRLLNQYFATYPEIANWHLSIAHQIKTKRFLTTPFGRKRYFFNRYNEGLVKEGLAFIPQSTVADIVGQALVKAHQEGIELLLQVHDSLLVQCKQEDVEATVARLRECLTCPLEINGKILNIPIDIKTGLNWQDMEKAPF